MISNLSVTLDHKFQSGNVDLLQFGFQREHDHMLDVFNPFKKANQNLGKPTFPVLLTQGSDSMFIKEWDLVSGPEPVVCMTIH